MLLKIKDISSKRENGFILITVLFSVILLLLLYLGTNYIFYKDLLMARKLQDYIIAYHLAEGGFYQKLSNVKKGQEPGTVLLITSDGKYNGSIVSLETKVCIEEDGVNILFWNQK